jgi:ABC-2 type transport system ATP-binding protein
MGIVTAAHRAGQLGDADDGATRLPAPAPAFVARGIVKRWQRNAPVLDGVELDLAPGALVGLVGRNGAGKTTLLRILSGLISPDSGSIQLDGLDPVDDRREYQKRLGFVSAGQSGLYARLTVKAHLDYWARLALLPVDERRVAVARMLASFDLIDLARSRVDRLSMGQRQRVRLAMAFLHSPRVVLLDEPRNSLDDSGVAALERATRELVVGGGIAVWCAPTRDAISASLTGLYELEAGTLARR